MTITFQCDLEEVDDIEALSFKSITVLTLDAANQWLDWENDRRKEVFFHLGMIKALADTMSIVLLSVYQMHELCCEYSNIFVLTA